MKKIIALFICATLLAVMLVGCTKGDKASDYSEYPFTDAYWTRDADYDIETIFFGADGRFSYFCGCGSPVNDSDLCEGYVYDDEEKTVTLECIETTEEMVTVIKIVKCTDSELHLDFDGDIRIFEK